MAGVPTVAGSVPLKQREVIFFLLTKVSKAHFVLEIKKSKRKRKKKAKKYKQVNIVIVRTDNKNGGPERTYE